MSYTIEDMRNLIREVELGKSTEISDDGAINLFKLERFLVDQVIDFNKRDKQSDKVLYNTGYADGHSDGKTACVNAIESL